MEISAMPHHNTVFRTILKLVPWRQFDVLVDEHDADGRVRQLTTKGQFLALLYGQLSAASSLREIVTGLSSLGRGFTIWARTKCVDRPSRMPTQSDLSECLQGFWTS
jgi:ribonuclease PH